MRAVICLEAAPNTDVAGQSFCNCVVCRARLAYCTQAAMMLFATGATQSPVCHGCAPRIFNRPAT
jgi:hypothetical protein